MILIKLCVNKKRIWLGSCFIKEEAFHQYQNFYKKTFGYLDEGALGYRKYKKWLEGWGCQEI